MLDNNTIQVVVQQLKLAIDNHDRWYKELVRVVACRLPYDQHDVAEDAHHQCRFGQWYYNIASRDPLRDQAGFVAMGVEHKRMHQLAAKVLLASMQDGRVSPHAYDDFANSLDRLRLQLYSLVRELEESLYNRDPLTGAESRMSMLIRLREAHELVKRNVLPCCISIGDLDDFKSVNDTYGHLVGDQVLARCVGYLLEHLRPYDRVFRFGGEEFLILMPNTNLQTAQDVIERIRQGLATLVQDGLERIFVTASFGIALIDPDVTVEESISRTDKAMYTAKTAGRNLVRVWDPSMTAS
jgi:diguanylate cyclase